MKKIILELFSRIWSLLNIMKTLQESDIDIDVK